MFRESLFIGLCTPYLFPKISGLISDSRQTAAITALATTRAARRPEGACWSHGGVRLLPLPPLLPQHCCTSCCTAWCLASRKGRCRWLWRASEEEGGATGATCPSAARTLDTTPLTTGVRGQRPHPGVYPAYREVHALPCECF